MKLPPRRLLESVLNDAIDDRRGFADANRGNDEVVAETRGLIARYRELAGRIMDPRALPEADVDTLRMATHHARIWRLGLLESWRGTGDKATIRDCRDDVARLERIERALGITPDFTVGGPSPAGARSMTVVELARTPGAYREITWSEEE